jgi:cysteinyl-tRNA synthetase
VEALISLREEARERKDYAEADRIRVQLKGRSIVLEDTPYGTIHWTEPRPARG